MAFFRMPDTLRRLLFPASYFFGAPTQLRVVTNRSRCSLSVSAMAGECSAGSLRGTLTRIALLWPRIRLSTSE